jgi:hypothetical protein
MVDRVISDNTKCRVHGVPFTLYRDTIMNLVDGVNCPYFDGRYCHINKKINGSPQPLCDYIADRRLFPDIPQTETEVIPSPSIDLSEIPPRISASGERDIYRKATA